MHHLDASSGHQTLTEVARVLRPGGSLHVMDIIGYRVHRGRHGLGHAIPDALRNAGFDEVGEQGHQRGRYGTVNFYRAALASRCG